MEVHLPVKSTLKLTAVPMLNHNFILSQSGDVKLRRNVKESTPENYKWKKTLMYFFFFFNFLYIF